MRRLFENNRGHEERMQVLRFLAGLAIFICALHLMCMRDARMALARVQLPHRQPVNMRIKPAPRAWPHSQS